MRSHLSLDDDETTERFSENSCISGLRRCFKAATVAKNGRQAHDS